MTVVIRTCDPQKPQALENAGLLTAVLNVIVDQKATEII